MIHPEALSELMNTADRRRVYASCITGDVDRKAWEPPPRFTKYTATVQITSDRHAANFLANKVMDELARARSHATAQLLEPNPPRPRVARWRRRLGWWLWQRALELNPEID